MDVKIIMLLMMLVIVEWTASMLCSIILHFLVRRINRAMWILESVQITDTADRDPII